MKGHVFVERGQAPGNLAPWEALVVDAVGNVIDFWGFKSNDGRVWALLYLRGRPLSALEIQRELGLSKGAVSMLTRELEQWGVIDRVRAAGVSTWLFRAETDLLRMVGRVIRERELTFVARVVADLEQAEALARGDDSVPPAVRERVRRMRQLAALIDAALNAFVKTARLDFGRAAEILGEVIPLGIPRGRR